MIFDGVKVMKIEYDLQLGDHSIKGVFEGDFKEFEEFVAKKRLAYLEEREMNRLSSPPPCRSCGDRENV